MTHVLDELKYTEEHEWVRVEDGKAIVGITDFAQNELTDVVYVEFPEIGSRVVKGEEMGAIESVKAVSEIYCPVTGKIVDVNHLLEESPELVNEDPYGEGWIVVIEMEDSSELDDLLDADEYRKLIGE